MEVEADGRRSLARTPGGDPARKDLEKLSMSDPTKVVRLGRRVRPRFSFRRGAAARGAERKHGPRAGRNAVAKRVEN